MSNARRPRTRLPRPASPFTARQAPRTPLPYADAEHAAQQLVAAVRLNDGGDQLGAIAGAISLDPRLAGTVLAILAHSVNALSDAAVDASGAG